MKNTDKQPPRFLLVFLRWFCHPDLAPYIEGDLMELFDENVKKKGKRWAQLICFFDVIKLLRLELIRTNGVFNIFFPGLVRSMLRSTTRRLIRDKAYAGTNVLGLTMGFLVFFVTVLYTDYEKSFDQHLANYEDVYRLEENWSRSGVIEQWSGIKARLSPFVNDNYSGVSCTRLFRTVRFELGFEEKKVQTDLAFYADSTFMKVFPYEAVEGDVSHMLKRPDQVILTQSMAQKLFGDEAALNQVIRVNKKSLSVSGVIQDPPPNTHVHFEILISMGVVIDKLNDFHLNDNMFYTYARIPEHKLVDVERNINERLASLPGYVDDLKTAGNTCHISLMPIQSIHLYGKAEREIEQNGNATVVNIIKSIGWFILFMSGINYINLATSRSMNRGTEVGIRKLHGSSKFMISLQFLSESLILCLLSVILGGVGLYALLPVFNHYFDIAIVLSTSYTLNLMLSGLGVAMVFGLLSGAYPAIEMSRIKVIGSLRAASSNKGMGGSTVRKGFIAFQLMIAVFTIMSVMIIYNQLNFIQNKNLGFDKSRLMVIPMNPDNYFDQIGRFKESLISRNEVASVTTSFTYPGKRFPFFTFRFPNLNQSGKVSPTQKDGSIWMRAVFGDRDMVDVFGLELISGRNLSKGITKGPPVEFIVNEAAARFFGLDDPVGETVEFTNNVKEPIKGQIIGLVKDFNYASLHSSVEPMILYKSNNRWSRKYMTIAFDSDPNVVAALVEKNWSEYLGNAPLEYRFLDDEYKELYKSESDLQAFIMLLSFISIVISMIGLVGMSFYAMQQKRHEIGIRKVHGASVLSILTMNTKEYLLMTGLVMVIVMPLTYWLGQNWLDHFAYSAGIGFNVFVITITFVIVLVLGSIGYNVLNSSLKNPVDTLFRG